MKKALIVYGGQDGHDPEGVANVFADILREENFEVVLSNTLDTFLLDLTVKEKYIIIVLVITDIYLI